MLINPERTIRQILVKKGGKAAELVSQSSKLVTLAKLVQQHLDPALADKVRVIDYQKGTVTLGTDDPHWLHHLRYAIPDLLSALRNDANFYGLIAIKTKVLPPKSLGKSLLPQTELPTLERPASPVAAETIQAHAECCHDELLQQALTELSDSLKSG